MAENDSGGQVPSVDSITAELLAGLPGSSSQGPASAASEAPIPAGGGFRIVESTPEAQQRRDTQGPDIEALQREHQALVQRLEASERRVADNQRNFHQASQQAQLAQAVAEGLQQARQREVALYQQAAAMQPPTVQNPDELLGDGNKLLEYLNQRDRFVEGRVLAQLAPYVQQFATWQGLSESQLNLAKRTARTEARGMVHEQLGVDPKEFDAAYGELEQLFGAYGPQGMQMMLDPEQVRNAYVVLKVNRAGGANPFAKPGRSTVPPSADPRPGVSRPTMGREREAELTPMAREIARNLKLGGSLPIEASDLASLV